MKAMDSCVVQHGQPLSAAGFSKVVRRRGIRMRGLWLGLRLGGSLSDGTLMNQSQNEDNDSTSIAK
jgi:hypothetical protein